MACLGTHANKWDQCGVWTRCVIGPPHSGACEYQTLTQAVEEAVRIVLGDDSAEIGVRWAQQKIVGLLYNGHPLGKSEWTLCSGVGLPVIAWDGPPREAWEIDVGRAFRCNVCRKVVSASRRAADDMPDACDECWNKAHASDKCPAEMWIAEKGVSVRCMGAAESVGHQHQFEPAYAAAQRAVAENLNLDPKTVYVEWIDASHAWGVLINGAPMGAVELCSVCRTLPISGLYPPPAAEILGLPSVPHSPHDENHGRTLAAHCGEPWDGMSESWRAVWIQRAHRLRKRWSVDEMVDRLNADTDSHIELRKACRGEPEVDDGGSRCIASAAAKIIARLRQQATANFHGWGDALEVAKVALAQRDHVIAEQNRILDEIRVETEADDADNISDAAIDVIWRLRRERDEARETLHAERMAALTVLNAARNAVSQWSKWGSLVANSAMHDLRAVLEKVK